MTSFDPTRREVIAAATAAMAARALPARSAATEARGGPHHAPRAKRVVQLFMAGAPSNLDLFDDKPALRRYDGKPVPEHMLEGQRFAFLKGVPNLMASPYRFARYGGSARSSVSCCRTPRRSPTSSRLCARSTPTSSTTARRRCSRTPATTSSGGRAWAAGCCTASGPTPPRCRVSACWSAAKSTRARARRVGAAASCRRR